MEAKNNRAHPRANTLLPFQVRRLPILESEGLDCRLSTGGTVIEDMPLPQVQDEQLNQALNLLNKKLDYLISLASDINEGADSMGVEPLNISGGGMSLIAKEQFNRGDIVEIRMVLQTSPVKILHLYGEVVRIEATPNKSDSYVIGIKFVGMNDDVRNEILQFDFKKHREKLISRKNP
jgi:hypothetical protein